VTPPIPLGRDGALAGHRGERMNEEDLIFKKEGSIATITVHREEALNALNSAVLQRLEEILSDLEKDGETVVAVITGTGQKAFVAGADIKAVKEAGDKRRELARRGQDLFLKIRNSDKIFIAAVNGYALGGGCELALACDIRIASENATFGFPEAKLGLMPGFGGTQLLPRLIGTGRAKYMMFTGEMLTANEAYEFGLVEKVCRLEDLAAETNALAKKIAGNGPLSVKACKRAVDAGMELSLRKAIDLELEEYDQVARSGDAEEGIDAFLEKRKPNFKGK
jgi:enoyl-CoA hydratase